MIDNIKLAFVDKNAVEKWFNENKEKFNIKKMATDDEGKLLYPIKTFYDGLELRICDKIAYRGLYINFIINVRKSRCPMKMIMTI